MSHMQGITVTSTVTNILVSCLYVAQIMLKCNPVFQKLTASLLHIM